MSDTRTTTRTEEPTDDDEEVLVSVRDLKKYYDTGGVLGKDPVKAVDGVSLDIRKGETLGLVGESGCGKTTLGRTILNLETATEGAVYSGDTDISSISGAELREWQSDAQMVFQDPDSSLNDRMTVGEIIREPLDAHDWPRLSVAVEGVTDPSVSGTMVEPADPDDTRPDVVIDGGDNPRVRENLPLTADEVEVDREGEVVSVQIHKSKKRLRIDRTKSLLDTVGLQEEHFYRYPHQFSGGQSQRIGIARALALEPEFVVLDEPVSALDVSVQARIINLLEDLQDELGLTYLFIAHDLSVIRHIADRTAVMYLGNVVELGPTEEVFTDPAHPYTISLLSAIPGSRTDTGARITLRGTPPSPRDPPQGCPFSTRCPAKIRPDGYDELAGETWEALDELFTVFRAREQAEGGMVTEIARRLGLSSSDDVDEILLDLFADARREGDDEDGDIVLGIADSAAGVVHEAADRARNGDDAGAADRLREAFGSVCNRDHPDARDVGPGRESRCIRHDDEYEEPGPVIDARHRADD